MRLGFGARRLSYAYANECARTVGAKNGLKPMAKRCIALFVEEWQSG